MLETIKKVKQLLKKYNLQANISRDRNTAIFVNLYNYNTYNRDFLIDIQKQLDTIIKTTYKTEYFTYIFLQKSYQFTFKVNYNKQLQKVLYKLKQKQVIKSRNNIKFFKIFLYNVN